MAREDSEIYIGQRGDGRLITIFEYVDRATNSDHPPEVFCVNCADEGEKQPLTYLPTKHRFVHINVNRDCYQDHRTHDPDHPLTQQTAYREFENGPQYQQPSLEYSLTRRRGDNKLYFDLGAKWASDADLVGVLVEVQHRSGCFSRRLYPRLRIAHYHNYGVFVVFTPTASGRQWFSRRLAQMKNDDVDIGSYTCDNVNWGAMIRPGDDISVFKTEAY